MSGYPPTRIDGLAVDVGAVEAANVKRIRCDRVVLHRVRRRGLDLDTPSSTISRELLTRRN